jgi:hypothetical protein
MTAGQSDWRRFLDELYRLCSFPQRRLDLFFLLLVFAIFWRRSTDGNKGPKRGAVPKFL